MLEGLLKGLLILWCLLCGFTETCAVISVWKRAGALSGVITALMMATPWLLLA